MQKVVLLLTIILFLLHTCQTTNSTGLNPQVQQFYMDRVKIWTLNGSEIHTPNIYGYNYSLTFRNNLPSIHQTALGLHNFQCGYQLILSLMTQLTSLTLTSTVINIKIVDSGAGIIFLAYSIFISTYDSMDFEMITFTETNIYVGRQSWSLYANSTKFDWSSEWPNSVALLQWMTGQTGYNLDNITASVYVTLYAYPVDWYGNQIQLSFWTERKVYLAGFKVNLFIFGLLTGSSGRAYFSSQVYPGNTKYSWTAPVPYNLGVDVNIFGEPSIGLHCFHGFRAIELQLHYLSNYTGNVQFYFLMNGIQISSSYNNYVNAIYLLTFCVESCPASHYFDGTQCQTCNSAMINCDVCYGSNSCVRCLHASLVLVGGNSCQCPGVRSYFNATSNLCQSCPYDCLSCLANGNCITCDGGNDFRVLSGGRCVPVTGYYESNVTVALPCMSNCDACLSATDCSSCLPYYLLTTSGNMTSCQACPFDCYTCDSSENCLTCDNTTDFRTQNGTRCLPISGYYESNVTVAGQCSVNCLLCTNSSICLSCLNNYSITLGTCGCPNHTYESTLTCLACRYDCYTCTNTSACTSCSSSLDNRVLNGSSCVPLTGYYQTYTAQAAACSSNCLACRSSTYCYQCQIRYIYNYTQYALSNVLNCFACPYDCYACYQDGRCSTCSATVDYRQLSISTNRCLPIAGYFESNTSTASKCTTGCATCTSLVDCNQCASRYTLNQTIYNNNGTKICQGCPYDCYTCNSNGQCLTCHPVSDYRTLNGTRCVPIAGYYENYQTVSAVCPSGCTVCSSSQSCSACDSEHTLEGQACFKNSTIHILIIIIPVAFGLILLTVLIICLCCYCRKQRKIQLRKRGFRQNSQGQIVEISQNTLSRLSRMGSVPDEVTMGDWEGRKASLSKNYQCGICLGAQAVLRSSCGHFSHTKCLLGWIKQQKKCPSCVQQLDKKEHLVVCKICRKKERKMSYGALLEIGKSQNIKKETICSECLEDPFVSFMK